MREAEAQKVVAGLGQELQGIRAGRATPALLERVRVEAYGSTMPLSAVAGVSIPDPRTIVIEPWDATLVPAIVQALGISSLGLAPIVDQRKIRLSLPPLTRERRTELARLVSEKAEEARVKVRHLRERERERIIAEERSKKISTDGKFRQLKALDKETDQWMEKIEELRKNKEAEILQ